MDLLCAQSPRSPVDLVLPEHLGINVYSLFAEFEPEQVPFEAALALHPREVVGKVFSAPGSRSRASLMPAASAGTPSGRVQFLTP
jgi:hypothetical protein